MSDEATITTLWGRHRQWSIAADRLKAGIARGRTVVLVLGVAGAALQTLSVTLSAENLVTLTKVVSAIGAVALAVVPLVTARALRPEQVRRWLRARSVSEGLKSEVFRYRAHAEPYAAADRTTKLQASGKAIERWVADTADVLASIAPDAEGMPKDLEPNDYVQQRVNQQIDKYYRPNARKNAQRMALFRDLEIGTGILAAVLGAMATGLHLKAPAGSTSGVGGWVAVLTTIGGTFVAHAAASRYEAQARSYFATKRQLEDLRDAWQEGGSPGRGTSGWSKLVGDCEECISAENRSWMAKLDPEEGKSGPEDSGAPSTPAAPTAVAPEGSAAAGGV